MGRKPYPRDAQGNIIRPAKPVAEATQRNEAQTTEQKSANKAESTLNAPKSVLTAFALVDDGNCLWHVEMLKIGLDGSLKRIPLSHPDQKSVALFRMRQSAYLLYFAEQEPEAIGDPCVAHAYV